jgi:hypothetical protein
MYFYVVPADLAIKVKELKKSHIYVLYLHYCVKDDMWILHDLFYF